MNKYFIEITDTFGGEANYSWVRRYFVTANNERGAVNKIARKLGAGWRNEYSGELSRYSLSGACICMFVQFADEYVVDRFGGLEVL